MEMIKLNIKKMRETEKAIYVKIPYHNQTGNMRTFKAWLPKSQLTQTDNIIEVACWIIEKKAEEYLDFMASQEQMIIMEEGPTPEIMIIH